MRTLKQLQTELDRALKNAVKEAKGKKTLKLPNDHWFQQGVERRSLQAYAIFYNSLTAAEIDKYRVRHPTSVSPEELFYNRS